MSIKSLAPANKVWDNIIFSETCVIPSVHRRGLPPGESAQSPLLPLSGTTAYSRRAGGTHPTRMHSCSVIIYLTDWKMFLGVFENKHSDYYSYIIITWPRDLFMLLVTLETRLLILWTFLWFPGSAGRESCPGKWTRTWSFTLCEPWGILTVSSWYFYGWVSHRGILMELWLLCFDTVNNGNHHIGNWLQVSYFLLIL